jgi:hypothetical protein
MKNGIYPINPLILSKIKLTTKAIEAHLGLNGLEKNENLAQIVSTQFHF